MPSEVTGNMLKAGAAMLGFHLDREGGTFSLPPLPYDYNKNEPAIDGETMRLHHDRHHASYVQKFKAAASKGGAWTKKPLHEILASLPSVPESVRAAVRTNAGGHANHTMFWQIMGGDGGKPTGELAVAIARDFGSFENLQTAFNNAGASHTGSGWVFVTVDGDGKLGLTTKPNQDTPLMDGERVLFGNDVWEHAYYLKYNDRRADYLRAWWSVLDWDKIAERYEAAKRGALTV
ncbi:superoxide dismutase [Rhodomicrobium udaipurense JA643]|uniref:Superoxide dismutase n=1 Tax=Rhodomicrobium udaipurense TaxID=1202716 RepID=A0A8I1GIH1_9HYPH|nr:superoxide dismutase [Rhodomicrobium udaipurense]KAI96013.1 superoxide dismutase [Rhodomicrobium udaipurense JA643]MBJ7544936.1 superoxide dismutase [Rhodomicrobium udaipurense]